MVASLLLLVALASPPDFEAIVAGVNTHNHLESCASMLAWAAAHKDDPQARTGRVWCARLLYSDGQPGDARPVLEAVISDEGHDEAAMQALSTLAAIEFELRHFQAAAEDFGRLVRSPNELWQFTGTQALIEVKVAQQVWWQAVAIGCLLGLWLAARLFTVRRALVPVPAEVLVLAPLLLLLGAMAFTQGPDAGRALSALVLGALVLAWLNGAYLRAHPPQGKARVLEAFKSGLQGLLWLDVVLAGSGLWRPLWQSLLEGFE